jgi:hypothetical protein
MHKFAYPVGIYSPDKSIRRGIHLHAIAAGNPPRDDPKCFPIPPICSRSSDGQTTWSEGAPLAGVYILVATAFFFMG